MNLTSKRMLQFMTVCAGALALSATATTTWVGDSFEAPEGTNGNKIASYKRTVSGTNNEYTNLMWTAADGDESAITNGANGYTTTLRPMTNATDALYLNLQTEGQTLSRKVYQVVGDVTSAVPITTSSSVYVDTLIKFTPSEDTPDITDPAVKVAVFVNVNTNLVVFHMTDFGGTMVSTNSVFSSLGPIDPTKWYRLTMELKNMDLGRPACKIYLDGQALTNGLTYTDGGAFGGPWFLTVNTGYSLSSVAFQGTGAVDELVVADGVQFTIPLGMLLTLSYDSGILAVNTNGAPVGLSGTVADGTTVTIQCTNWYQVASITGATYPEYGGNLSASNQLKTATVTLTAGHSTNVIITSEKYTGTFSTGSGSVDANKLANWAIANNKSEADVTANAASWMDDYLLNVAPDTNAQLKIMDIVYDSGTATATITVGADKPAVNFTSLNGTMTVRTSTTLTSWGTPALYSITATTNTYTTIDVPNSSGNFIRAVVQ
jgi:hypothetical protein